MSARGTEKFVVSMSDGFPNASTADVSMEPKNSEGKYWARVSVGNTSDGKWFDSKSEAKAWAERFTNPPEGRKLSSFVRSKGKIITAKYDSKDIYGNTIAAGTKIYYLRSANGNTTYILPAD